MDRRLATPLVLVIVPLLAASLHAQQVVRGPYLQCVTDSSVIVRWRTDVPTDARVGYGPAGGAMTSAVTDSTVQTDHEVQITGLVAGSAWAYDVGTTTTVLSSGADHRFRTAPPVGSSTGTRVWVLGDPGTASTTAIAVRDAYHAWNGDRRTDMVLMLGDNAYPDGTDAQYQAAMFDMYPEALRGVPFWSTLGNHDAHSTSTTSTGESGPYYDIFNLPDAGQAGGMPSGTEGYYSFDWANIHFICLNSAQGDATYSSAMLAWLQADLASTLQEWVIAYWHHPPYSKGSHDSDTEAPLVWMRQNVLPVLEAGGVDLVLCGHSHGYERSMLLDGHHGDSTTFDVNTMAIDPGDGDPAGTGPYRKASHGPAGHEGAVYAVAGASGAVSPVGTHDHPVMIRENHVVGGSMILDVNGSQLDVSYLDENTEVFDRFTIVKGGVTPVPYRRALVPEGAWWRAHDAGIDFHEAWLDSGFDDSGWGQVPCPMGFGEAGLATVLGSGQPTYYFRRTFEFRGDLALVDTLRLLVDHDDGFVAWLNGIEIARSASVPPGLSGFGTPASSHESGVWEANDVTAFKYALVPGDNLLAIEVHQESPTNGDLWFDAILEVEGFEPLLGPAGAGSVSDPSGTLVDMLRVNDSSGALARSVDLRIGDPFSISMAQPPLNANPAAFLVAARAGIPTLAETTVLPNGVGSFLFDPLGGGVSYVTSSFGPIPGMLLSSSTAPWGFAFTTGFPLPVEFTLQGLINDTPGTIAVTNGVRVEVLP